MDRLINGSGEGGIRTHGGPKGHNGFRDRPIQPLWHLSSMAARSGENSVHSGGYYILKSPQYGYFNAINSDGSN